MHLLAVFHAFFELSGEFLMCLMLICLNPLTFNLIKVNNVSIEKLLTELRKATL